jgi:VanZ family protein
LSSSTLERPAPRLQQPLVLYWLPTLLWLCLLAWFSSDTFSAEHTGRILGRIIHFLFGDVSRHTFQQIHFLVRKSAHFCSYGLLSAFAFFSWRATLPLFQPWAARWSGLALLLTLAAGSADEFHQSFSPSRTSSLHDVGIDFIGALFFQALIACVMWLRATTARQRGTGR